MLRSSEFSGLTRTGSTPVQSSGLQSKPDLYSSFFNSDSVVTDMYNQLTDYGKQFVDSYLSVVRNIPVKYFDKQKFREYVLQIFNEDMARQKTEAREDSAIQRQASALRSVGVNTDLMGVGNGASSSAVSPFSTPGVPGSSVSSGSGLQSLGFSGSGSLNVDRVLNFGKSLLGVAVMGFSLRSSILGASGIKSSVLSDVLQQVPTVLDGMEITEDMSSGDIASNVLGVLLGPEGSRISGLSRKQSDSVRASAADFIESYLGSKAYGIRQANLSESLSKSRYDARVAAYNDSVDEASGVHSTTGPLFEAEVAGIAKIKQAELAASVASAEAAQAKAEYEREFNSSLDADLAARAQNEENRERYEESKLNADIASNTSGSDIADYNSEKRDLELKKLRRLDSIQEIQAKADEAAAQVEVVVNQVELAMVKSMELNDKVDSEVSLFDPLYIPQKSVSMFAEWYSKRRSKRFKKSIGKNHGSKFSINTPVGGVSYSE